MKIDKVLVYCDGGSRGNPGPSAAGVVIKTTDGKKLFEISNYLGTQTNNFAEYSAVLVAIKKLKQEGIKKADFFLDSELVVKQLNGLYRVKNDNIKPLYQQIISYSTEMNIKFNHIYRKDNTEADLLVNKALNLNT